MPGRDPRRARTRGWLLVAPASLLVVPVVAVAIGSLVLTSLGLLPLFGPVRLSLDGYASAAPDLLTGVRESLLIAVTATTIALLVGGGTAALLMSSAHGRTVLGPLTGAVVTVPHLVGAAATMLLLSGGGWLARLTGTAPENWPQLVGGPYPSATVLEFAWKESAFVALVVLTAAAGQVATFTDPARVLGARAGQRLRMVTLPLMAPALWAAGIVVFVYTLGSYEVAWLLGRPYPEPLPVMAYRLYTSIDLAARPASAATAVVALGMAVLAAVGAVPMLHRLGAAR